MSVACANAAHLLQGNKRGLAPRLDNTWHKILRITVFKHSKRGGSATNDGFSGLAL